MVSSTSFSRPHRIQFKDISTDATFDLSAQLTTTSVLFCFFKKARDPHNILREMKKSNRKPKVTEKGLILEMLEGKSLVQLIPDVEEPHITTEIRM